MTAPSKHIVVYNALEGEDARILMRQARDLMARDRVLIHVVLDDQRLSILRELIAFFAPDIEMVEFPAWDCLPYDRVSPHQGVVAKRVAALSTLRAWEAEQARKPRILLTTINAIAQRVMPQASLAQSSFVARKGGTLDMAELQEFLSHNGYVRTDTVRESGEYALRGGLMDLFPSGNKEPLRLDLFGDEIESIRLFDPVSQRAYQEIKDFALRPIREFFLDERSIDRFRSGYREIFGVVQGVNPLYESISEGRLYKGAEHWLPLFYGELDTLFDYVPNAALSFDHHVQHAYDEHLLQIQDFYQSRKTLEKAGEKAANKASSSNKKMGRGVFAISVYHPLPVAELYIEAQEWAGLTGGAEIFSPFSAPEESEEVATKKGRDFTDIRSLPDGDVMGELRQHLVSLSNPSAPRKILIACYSEGSTQRMQALMEAVGIGSIIRVHNAAGLKSLKAGQIGLVTLGLEHGFTAPDLAVLTEADILGDRLARKASKRKKADNFLREVSSLDERDLVTHIDHGVGKFLALETMHVGKIVHDCLKIEYAGGDKLFVPVENIDILSRFGSDEGNVQLDKLGGAGWQARKARVKQDLMEMADKLLKIAAARQLRKTEPITISQDLYNEFTSRFPYTETEDQARSIDQVLESLAGTHPMDRLVCGDVGFGKTEVAIRAAYVAAMDGYQVALVAPTTLLVRQHYHNFAARFAGTGLRLAQLSRLVNASDAQRVKEELADGRINIIIGTHALFSSSIKFNNIGLMIVDEEQRFGVKQKERLKALKSNVHVLTLTATPIPRTLQMALTGVKEMSLITTPPVDRLAVRTFVMPMDMMVIREALLREHYRGGQSFYVCPRVKDMPDLEALLKEHVPEVKIISAHGQMSPTDLEDRMSAFYDGQYDVLLATNIIESGIDIPTANTMIIHRADMFGLAQLYQIRGRIGRSKVRAYAYLTYAATGQLSDTAQKRLEVMETLDTLGSGFQLASHDMDIRGAGNLLGDKQSGHIREIGVELYQEMLEEAVALARSGVDLDDLPEEQGWSPIINIGMSVLIPEEYVPDLGVRMSLYRRLSDLIEPDDIESFAAELIDRFGDLPSEVENLMSIVAIKQLCKKAGISSIEAGPKGAVMAFHESTPPDIPALLGWINDQRGSVKLRPDQKLVVTRPWGEMSKRVRGVKILMQELAKP